MPATPPPMTRAALRHREGHLVLGRQPARRAPRRSPPGPWPCSVAAGRVVAVHPGAVLAQVRHLHQVRVQPHVPDAAAERRLVHPGRAGGDDHPVELVLDDGLLDLLLARLGARVLVADGGHDAGQRRGVLRHRLRVDGAGDVAAAVADEHTDTRKGFSHSVHLLLRWPDVESALRCRHPTTEARSRISMSGHALVAGLRALQVYQTLGAGGDQRLAAGRLRLPSTDRSGCAWWPGCS